MPYIFILRHGPVYYNHRGKELLDEREFKKIMPKIIKHISNYCDINTIYTSPVLRCELTADILAREFYDCDVRVRKELLRRPNGSAEKRCCAHKRGYTFGVRVSENAIERNENIAIVTHSSMYQSVVEGIMGIHLNDTHFQNENKLDEINYLSNGRVHIKDTAMTVYNVEKGELYDFNVEMYSKKSRK